MNMVSETENILRPENRPFHFPSEDPHFPCGKDTDNVITRKSLYPFPRIPLTFPSRNTSPGRFPDLEELLNIPDITVEKTEINREGDVIITVRSTAEGTRCGRCGAETDKPYGHGREITLRHLSVFGRKTYIRICPPRYQCTRCKGNPVTTQKASWYEQRSPHTAEYEKYISVQMINSTIEDVSIKEDLGYEAVTGIITRRIASEPDWDEITGIDTIGLDEISLKKGHKDFVTIVTCLTTEGETLILAVLGDRKKETVKKFLKTIPKRLRKKIRGVCSDLYEGFINAAKEVFGKRMRIVADRFHVARLYRKGFDGLRKNEIRRLKKELSEDEYGKLKNAMRILRKKEESLSDEEKEVLKCLFGHSPELKLAHDFCRELTEIFDEDISQSDAKRKIRIWKIRVTLSGLKCYDSFIKTLEKFLIITDLGDAPVPGVCPRLSVFTRPRAFPGNGSFRRKKYAGHPVRNVPERTDLPFCCLIISGCCALP
ncbi:ISL3 family transposase [Desulfococcaceae bacterium HSG8]|nr:ISL3 family transposase [Desulfococcaceae bacterium HSG8]